MIVCEEKAFERILFAGFCDTAIPVSVRLDCDSELTITTLPSLKGVAREFEKLFGHDPFSKKAHEWLKYKLRPFMFERGFCDNRQSRKIIDVYTRDMSASTLDPGDSIILTAPIKNATTADIDSLIEFGHTVSAIVRDGEIVSVAYTDLVPDSSYVEVGIETVPKWRKKGLAKAALSGLILELKRNGVAPIFICSRSNRASISTAHSLGFKKESTEYNYVFRRR